MRVVLRMVIVLVVSTIAFAVPVSADPNQALEQAESPDPTYEANIVYGNDSAGFNPGVVFYVVYRNDGSDPTVCGGTAISSTWILTAAHCVYGSTVDRAELIEAGTVWSYQSPRILVSQIVVHPGYNPGVGAEPLRSD
ncbi:MAG: trypsin-like serine protease, partial [Acidimicrobiales bacterium]